MANTLKILQLKEDGKLQNGDTIETKEHGQLRVVYAIPDEKAVVCRQINQPKQIVKLANLAI